jgi:hypothetical protein
VLASGLPPEANVWRDRGWPMWVEFLALLVERNDEWHNALLAVQCGEKAQSPGVLKIRRPGEVEQKPERKRFDPHRVAAGLRQIFGK